MNAMWLLGLVPRSDLVPRHARNTSRGEGGSDVMVAYPVIMGLALVYTAEHYVIDVVLA